MTAPVDALVQWNGLTLGAGLFHLNTLTGWLDLPGASYESQPAHGHGVLPSPGVQGPRVVLAGGLLWGVAGMRDQIIAQLRSAMIPRDPQDQTLDDLTVTAAGVTATAKAQLEFRRVPMDPKVWASGVVPWSAQWRCPNPRVYGATVTATAPLVTASAGITLPQTLPFTMPAQPIGGQTSVFNPGNDPEGSPVLITLMGAQSGSVGVVNVTTGATVTYNLGLGTGDTLVIDSEFGARLNGEYRPSSGWSALASDLRAAPGTNVFRALGTAGAGSPSITVAVRPASW